MQIGVPKEIKNHEYRVGLPPAGVVELVKYGHEVLVEMGAGDGAGFDDLAYSAAGATLVDSPSTISSQLISSSKSKSLSPMNASSYDRDSYCLPTFISLLIACKRTCCCAVVPPASLTRQSRVTMVAYHCWHLCPKLPGDERPRRVVTS